MNGALVNNAKDAYNLCHATFQLNTPLSKRQYLFIPKNAINRDRKYTNVQTLTGTRNIHQVLNMPGMPYNLQTRSLSCFCSPCLQAITGNDSISSKCDNISVVPMYKQSVPRLKTNDTNKLTEDVTETNTSVPLQDLLDLDIDIIDEPGTSTSRYYKCL